MAVASGFREAVTRSAAIDIAAQDDLMISLLKAIPDGRYRCGVRYPQWWMLLVAILSILSGQGSLLGIERFTTRHRKTLNELLGTQVARPPSDSTFRLLLSQLDVDGFESLLQDWMSAQIGDAEPVDTLVCDGKTLRGSIDETPTGAARCGLRPTASTRSGEPLLQQPRRGQLLRRSLRATPRAPTPPIPAVRSRRYGSCSIVWSS